MLLLATGAPPGAIYGVFNYPVHQAAAAGAAGAARLLLAAASSLSTQGQTQAD